MAGRKGPLTQDEKDYMQARRTQVRQERVAALELLQSNPQLTNAKFWKGVDPVLAEDVANAIRKANREAKLNRIKALEREIEEIQNEM